LKHGANSSLELPEKKIISSRNTRIKVIQKIIKEAQDYDKGAVARKSD